MLCETFDFCLSGLEGFLVFLRLELRVGIGIGIGGLVYVGKGVYMIEGALDCCLRMIEKKDTIASC